MSTPRARASGSTRSRRAGALPRPGTSRTSSSGPPSGDFGVKYFEGLLGVGALHSKINLPLKWFLGTYPVFLDLINEAMQADTPEPARIAKKSWGRGAESVDLAVLYAAERALGRIFNYDSQAIVEAFYYDTFASMGVNLRTVGEAGPAATSPTSSAPCATRCTRRCRPSAPRPSRCRTCARR